MTTKDKFNNIVNKPLTAGIRSIVAIILAPVIFYLGIKKYTQNDIIMPLWERDFSDLMHGLTGVGSTGNVGTSLPAGVVGLIAAVLVGFMAYKAVAKYPKHLSFHYLALLLIDYLVISTMVNIFIFSGSAIELIYYGGAFGAGVFVVGDRVTSQGALLGLIGLVLVRLVYVDNLYPYVYAIPILSLIYVILRAPLESEEFSNDLKNYSLSKAFGKE